MSASDNKIRTAAYMIKENFTPREIRKLILVLLDYYFDKDVNKKEKE